jgi:adenylyltransferase/sulfurtransferase
VVHKSFSKAEIERYSRHLIIPEFNIDGQARLKAARVLVVGIGGLGAPLLQYLAAAGVGTIGMVDFDQVDSSNLQRQVLFTNNDIGRLKTEVAAERLSLLNPYISCKCHNTRLTSENALEIIGDYDLVVDGTDNFPTRYLVNDACVLLDKVNVFGSIFRFEGQLSVFNYVDKHGVRGPNFRDIFPKPPPPGLAPSCAEEGVIGVLPGIIGSLQANEVIKILSKVGEPLSGKLFLFDAKTLQTRTLKIKRRQDNPLNGIEPSITKLIDYEHFCGWKSQTDTLSPIKSISVNELAEMYAKKKDFQLIDVRQPHEYKIVQIKGEMIPESDLLLNRACIADNKPVVLMCRSGKRSAEVIRKLEADSSYNNLYNLEGGLLAWIDQIDPSLPKY